MKINIIISLFVFFLTSIICLKNTNANDENYEKSFGTPQIVDFLNFKASLQSDGSVKTSWNDYTEDLMYYKVSRSQTNKSPVYPDDGYIFYSSEETSYIDYDPQVGENYYRVCAIKNSKARICSNVVTIVTNEKNNKEESFDNYNEDLNSEENENSSIDLKIKKKNGKPYLQWILKGGLSSPQGFKVAISTVNKYPTYPVKEGDSYEYFSDENIRSFYHSNAEVGLTYYYRVCEYLGGKCGIYSNAVSAYVANDSSNNDVLINNKDTTYKTTKFKDVPIGSWFEKYLDNFIERGIISGYSDGNFQPSKNVNRAEMAKMVVKTLGIEVTESNIEIFCDVKTTDWFSPYVLQLYFSNIVDGNIGGNCEANRVYNPLKTVTRAEAIKIILLMFNAKVEPLDINQQTGFTDVDSSHWAAPYIKEAFSLGIIRGYDDGSFRPSQTMTRAEFVKMLSEAEKAMK